MQELEKHGLWILSLVLRTNKKTRIYSTEKPPFGNLILYMYLYSRNLQAIIPINLDLVNKNTWEINQCSLLIERM